MTHSVGSYNEAAALSNERAVYAPAEWKGRSVPLHRAPHRSKAQRRQGSLTRLLWWWGRSVAGVSASRSLPQLFAPMNTIACALLWVLLPLLVIGTVIAWLNETPTQRIHRLRRSGWSQQRIADHLGLSRTTVRRRLATA